MIELLCKLESPLGLRKRYTEDPESIYDVDYLILSEELIIEKSDVLFDSSLEDYLAHSMEEKRDAKHIVAWHIKGDRLQKKGDWVAAADCYNQAIVMAIKQNDEIAEAQIRTALIGIKLKMKMWGEALQLLEKNDVIYESQDFLPQKIMTQLHKALMQICLGNLDEVARILRDNQHLNEMRADKASNAEVFHNRILLYFLRARFELACGNFDKALQSADVAESLVKMMIFENLDALQLSWFQSCLYQIRIAAGFMGSSAEKIESILRKFELIARQFPEVISPLTVTFWLSIFEMKFRDRPLSDDAFYEILRGIYDQGSMDLFLEQGHFLITNLRERFAGLHFEKTKKFYLQKVRALSRNLPTQVARRFEARYAIPDEFLSSPIQTLLRLVDIARDLLTDLDVKRLSEKVLLALLDLEKMERGFIFLNKEDSSEFVVSENIQIRSQNRTPEDDFLSEVSHFVCKTSHSFWFADCLGETACKEWQAAGIIFDEKKLAMRSLVALPLIFSGKVLGMIYLDSHFRRPDPTIEEMELLKKFTETIAAALVRSKSFQEKEKSLEMTRHELGQQKKLNHSKYALGNFLGVSEKASDLLALVEKISHSSATALLIGESGVGKERLAKMIHFNSERKNQNFVPLNCAAIPESLVEAELFGYEKGAFTDASESRKGLLEQADKGTLFLDEIGELPLVVQAKLLRVLEESEITPLGGSIPRKVNFRLICATNRDLRRLVAEGKFREDLYFRIHVVSLNIPPLRERREDIPLIIHDVLASLVDELGVSKKNISPEAMAFFSSYSWPGNIRELRNVLQNLVLFTDDACIEIADLQKRMELFHGGEFLNYATGKNFTSFDELTERMDKGLLSLSEAKQEFERLHILRALQLCEGRITTASQILQMPRPQVSRLVKKYGIKKHEEDSVELN